MGVSLIDIGECKSMVQSELIGYVRKNKSGNVLKISISVEAFENAQRYLSQDGHEYVSLVMNPAKLQEILDGAREVTSVCQIKE